MKANLEYLWYVLRHKWFVFVECVRLGIPWRGLVHDMSKFAPREWFPYVEYFYGSWRNGSNGRNIPAPSEVQMPFNRAWNHHQKVNDHHWQHWLLVYDNPFSKEYYGIWHDSTNKYIPNYIGLAGSGEPLMAVEIPPTYNEWHDFMDAANAFSRASKAINNALRHNPEVLDMPLKCRKEMLADWRGAGKAQGKPDTKEWYLANLSAMYLHPDTRAWIEEQLGIEHADGVAVTAALHEKRGAA